MNEHDLMRLNDWREPRADPFKFRPGQPPSFAELVVAYGVGALSSDLA